MLKKAVESKRGVDSALTVHALIRARVFDCVDLLLGEDAQKDNFLIGGHLLLFYYLSALFSDSRSSIDVPSVLQPNDRTIPFDSEVPPAFPSLRRGPVPGQQPYRRLQSSAYGAQ